MKVNITQLVVRTAGMMVAFAIALFIPAGTLAWPAGWTFFLLMWCFSIAMSLWLFRSNPDLLAERLTGIGRSFYIFYVTSRENTFLSPAVRVQIERGHTVVSTGPYRYVRHPMYAGFVAYTLGIALLLGSWYGLLGGLLLIGLIAWRAVQEEQVLQEELQGYSDYMHRVRYRFIPHVW